MIKIRRRTALVRARPMVLVRTRPMLLVMTRPMVRMPGERAWLGAA